jgi:hypothetical protein
MYFHNNVHPNFSKYDMIEPKPDVKTPVYVPDTPLPPFVILSSVRTYSSYLKRDDGMSDYLEFPWWRYFSFMGCLSSVWA